MIGKKGTNTNHKSEFSILIVEDEIYNYLFLYEVLNKFEVTLIRAVDGREAVNICKKRNDIQLLLMDIRMPVMDGYEATKIIREFKPDIPIIAQTAYAMEVDRKRVYESGFSDYLPKPISKNDLIESVSRNLPEGFSLILKK